MNAASTPPQTPLPTARPSLCVLVGRFQPFHQAHLALLQRALALAPRCVVVIGSAFQARTPKNPFTWAERAEMIRLALPEVDRARVDFLPVRDYFDEPRWLRAVHDGVAKLSGTGALPEHAEITLIGHFKDPTSGYLRGFPAWTLHAADPLPGADGTRLRDAFFGADPARMEATLAAFTEQVPASTRDFLLAWSTLPEFATLAEEWALMQAYRASWSASPFPPVFVTVDAVVRCAGHVLLIRRGNAPGRGLLAVPGGFIDPRETAYQSALRELAEETHLRLLDDTMRSCLRATVVFDHPDRSLYGRVITHAHYFDLGERELPEVRADDDAQAVAWTPIADLPGMETRFHDDHFHMLDHFLGLGLQEATP